MATLAAPPATSPTATTAAAPSTPPCGTAIDAVRAFGVVFGGSVIADAAAAASAVAAGRAVARRRRPRAAALLGVAATTAYATALVPWMRRWGTARDDAARPLPGDDEVPEAGIVTTRTVTIDAPAERVWPWLAQIGQDRGGFYSHAWLENLAGCRLRNADVAHDNWQHRDVGELVMLHPAHGVRVTRFEPGRVLGLEGWGTFVVEPLGACRSRLIVRGRVRRGWASATFYTLLVEVPHFIMERKMLLGIKQRAEALAPHARQRA